MNTAEKQITSPTSIGNVSYTGIGFQGKLLLVYGGKAGGLGDAADAIVSLGAATDSTHRVAGIGRSTDASAAGEAGNGRSTTVVVQYRNAAGTVLMAADFVSWDADGFTINWTTVHATTREFVCVVMGGADFQAEVGQSQAPAATGSQSVTALPFQPNCAIFFDGRLGATATGSGTFWRPMYGFADSAGNVGSWSGDSYDAVATMDTHYCQSTSACMIGTASTTGTIDRRATFTSWNSDGFTVNWTTLDATVGVNSYYFYVAIKAPFSLAGSTDQRTTTGTTDVATTGFTPRAVLLGGVMQTAIDGGGQQHRFAVGAAVGIGAAQQHYITIHDEDNVATSNASVGMNSGKVLRWITAGGATPTTIVEAGMSVMQRNKFTLDYTTVSATANKVIYLAIGDLGRIPRYGFIHHNNPAVA